METSKKSTATSYFWPLAAACLLVAIGSLFVSLRYRTSRNLLDVDRQRLANTLETKSAEADRLRDDFFTQQQRADANQAALFALVAPSPASIPADWQTFTSEDGQYQLKYPTTWKVLFSGPINSEFQPSGSGQSPLFEVRENPLKTAIYEVTGDSLPLQLVSYSQQDAGLGNVFDVFGSQLALRQDQQNPAGLSSVYHTVHDNKMYEVILSKSLDNQDYASTVETMRDSFRFLK